jgi:hypothetical protein
LHSSPSLPYELTVPCWDGDEFPVPSCGLASSLSIDRGGKRCLLVFVSLIESCFTASRPGIIPDYEYYMHYWGEKHSDHDAYILYGVVVVSENRKGLFSTASSDKLPACLLEG